MKRMMLYIVAISAIGFAGLMPFDGTDVEKLHPVEVLTVTATAEGVAVGTDTALYGRGVNMQNAIEDLKLSASGEIFLETANYVLVSSNYRHLIGELYVFLRPACQIYEFTGNGEMKDIAKYLECHPSDVTILDFRQGKVNIPKLIVSGEDYKIDRS